MDADKANQMILCVPADIAMFPLDTDVEGQMAMFRGDAQFRLRGDIEEDDEYRQVCTYCVIFQFKIPLDPPLVLTYRRPSGDPRLLGKASVGFGGHIEAIDWPGGCTPGPDRLRRAVESASQREIREELGIADPSPSLVGLIRDDSDSVGRCHLGVLSFGFAFADLRGLDGDGEVGTPAWMTVDEALALDGLEGWSRIALEAVRDGVVRIDGINGAN